MSIMICNACKTLYGPTLFVCPECGSSDVETAQIIAEDPHLDTKHTDEPPGSQKASPKVQ